MIKDIGWSSLDDPSFIGNINMIRLHSLYLDIETGWYYNGKYYYDPANKIYLGATVDFESISTYEKFLKYYSKSLPSLNYYDLGQRVSESDVQLIEHRRIWCAKIVQ